MAKRGEQNTNKYAVRDLKYHSNLKTLHSIEILLLCKIPRIIEPQKHYFLKETGGTV